jgi:6,7-dimethyl-8-ribityllumazine synthase
MPQLLEGHLRADGVRLALVCSRFNRFITDRLLDGALDAVRRHGGQEGDVTVAWCPGAFEAPLVAQRLAQTGRFDAVVCLGAVIRGATTHYDHVAGGVGSGLMQAALKTDVPVLFGVLTVETIEQAIERAGTKAGNKGFEVTAAAIEMVDLLRRIDA